jgi:hypothetical protein
MMPRRDERRVGEDVARTCHVMGTRTRDLVYAAVRELDELRRDRLLEILERAEGGVLGEQLPVRLTRRGTEVLIEVDGEELYVGDPLELLIDAGGCVERESPERRHSP